jgi:hypothetical protein
MKKLFELPEFWIVSNLVFIFGLFIGIIITIKFQ